MKTNYLIFISFIIFFESCKTTSHIAYLKPAEEQILPVYKDAGPETVNFSEQSSWLLGYFKKGMLEREPHSSWYLKEYNDYMANSEAVNELKNNIKEGVTIKIVMGTWCPDSRREVPRFMRIVDLWHFPEDKITFIGVDNAKLSPVAEYEKLDIGRVPTFIIFKNNIEAGRIIENPVTSLEQDLVKILKNGMNK
jgi:thiol-disulfide isomerase/thioredoxin